MFKFKGATILEKSESTVANGCASGVYDEILIYRIPNSISL